MRSSTRSPQAPAVSSSGDLAGEYRNALPVRFTMTRSMIGGSAMTWGRSGGKSIATARA